MRTWQTRLSESNYQEHWIDKTPSPPQVDVLDSFLTIFPVTSSPHCGSHYAEPRWFENIWEMSWCVAERMWVSFSWTQPPTRFLSELNCQGAPMSNFRTVIFYCSCPINCCCHANVNVIHAARKSVPPNHAEHASRLAARINTGTMAAASAD